MLKVPELYFVVVHVSTHYQEKQIAAKFRHGTHSKITFGSLLLKVGKKNKLLSIELCAKNKKRNIIGKKLQLNNCAANRTYLNSAY